MHKDFRWYMLYKFAILNTFLLGITGVGLMNGWVQELYLRDSTYMTNVIIAVFVLGWCLCGYKIWQTSRELNRAKQKEAVKDSRFIQHRINIKRAGPAGRADINEALKV